MTTIITAAPAVSFAAEPRGSLVSYILRSSLALAGFGVLVALAGF